MLISVFVLVDGIVFNRSNDLMIGLTCFTYKMFDSMSDELKEVKYFKEIADFKSLVM